MINPPAVLAIRVQESGKRGSAFVTSLPWFPMDFPDLAWRSLVSLLNVEMNFKRNLNAVFSQDCHIMYLETH